MTPAAHQNLLAWLDLAGPQRGADPAALAPADWDELISVAYRVGVAPQLHRRLLAEAATHPVPRNVLQCLWLCVARQREDTRRFERELAAVLRALNGAGITPLLLKGAHLDAVVY